MRQSSDGRFGEAGAAEIEDAAAAASVPPTSPERVRSQTPPSCLPVSLSSALQSHES